MDDYNLFCQNEQEFLDNPASGAVYDNGYHYLSDRCPRRIPSTSELRICYWIYNNNVIIALLCLLGNQTKKNRVNKNKFRRLISTIHLQILLLCQYMQRYYIYLSEKNILTYYFNNHFVYCFNI